MLLGWSRLLILFLFLLWAPFIRYHEAFVCGIENVHDPLQHRVVLPLVLLANQLDVPQLSKIEVSLLLQVFHSKRQYIDLLHQFRGCLLSVYGHVVPWLHCLEESESPS